LPTNQLPAVSFTYITFAISLFAHKNYCLQNRLPIYIYIYIILPPDCPHVLLRTNKNFTDGVTFAYMSYICLHILLSVSIIIAYSSITYMYFCIQIKISETKSRLPTCIVTQLDHLYYGPHIYYFLF